MGIITYGQNCMPALYHKPPAPVGQPPRKMPPRQSRYATPVSKKPAASHFAARHVDDLMIERDIGQAPRRARATAPAHAKRRLSRFRYRRQ